MIIAIEPKLALVPILTFLDIGTSITLISLILFF